MLEEEVKIKIHRIRVNLFGGSLAEIVAQFDLKVIVRVPLILGSIK